MPTRPQAPRDGAPDAARARPAALVVGAGPAGLMAAEVLCAAGAQVRIADAMPSPARKFLMAGKSGLNLTKAEAPDAFRAAYAEAEGWLTPMLAAFGPDQVAAWARGLGQEVFVGATGRVFPTAMKASPLLRAWLARLDAGGAALLRRWRWTGWAEDGALRFATPLGERTERPEACVLALGGASWARLGSDGAWTGALAGALGGAALAPFQPANVGFRVTWSDAMARHFGQPVKPVALLVAGRRLRGEVVVSARGLEGGGLYAASRALREGAALALDLSPDLAEAEVAARLARPRGGATLTAHLRRTLRLDPVRRALLREFCGPLPASDPAALAALIKAVPAPLAGPRPMDEAISTAGGVPRAALDDGLMLRAAPGTHCAGEMLDWEAPTGGYLLTACLATGAWAGAAAARRLGLAPTMPGAAAHPAGGGARTEPAGPALQPPASSRRRRMA